MYHRERVLERTPKWKAWDSETMPLDLTTWSKHHMYSLFPKQALA